MKHIKAFASQIPRLLGANAQVLAGASAGPRLRAANLPGGSGSQEVTHFSELVRGKTLEQIYLDVWLPDMCAHS